MRFAIYTIMLVLACYGIYSLVKPETPPAKPVEPQPQASQPADQKSTTPTHAKSSGVTRITCPGCTGEGFVKTRRSGGGLELKQSCPVCMGRGYRDVTVNPGNKLCPDCRGMGSILLKTSTAQKTTCARCSASGVVSTVPK